MEIEHILTNLEVEFEKLEQSRKEQLLDMLDSFRNAIRPLLDPTAEEDTYDAVREEADRLEARDLEKAEREIQPVANHNDY